MCRRVCCRNGLRLVRGFRFLNESLKRTEHQSIVNIKDQLGKDYQLIAENGPNFGRDFNGKALLTDENQQPQAIEMVNGLGRVILFASHPEGSVYYQKFPQEFSGARYFKQLLERLIGD